MKQLGTFKERMARWAISGAVVLMGSQAFYGCGNSSVTNMISNVTLKTSVVGGDDWVDFGATLNTNGFTVAYVSLPIADPRDPSKLIGQVALTPLACTGGAICNGGNLNVSLNVTQASGIPGGPALLPNGAAIPITNIGNATVVNIPIPNSGARVYFAFAPGIAFVGTTVSFKELDPVGTYVPGAVLFQPIQAGPISLTGGIYAGSTSNTTGIGLFIDVSNVINKPTVGRALRLLRTNRPVNKMRFINVSPSYSKTNKLYTKLYELSRKNIKLKLK